MLRRFLLAALPLAVIIGLPLLFRKPAEAIDVTADQLVIVSPHNEAIRYEFEQAFREHYLRLTGRKVCIDWRATGGTSEIARYVSSAFTANFRHYWTHELKRDWNEEVEQAFMNKRLKPGDPGYEARKAFLESDVGIDIDLFFGGGQYDLSNQAAMGTLVPCGVRERHPEWFSGENPVLIQAKGGETWYDKGDCYYGACFSSFGICQNLDRLAALGYDMPAEGGGPLRSWTDLADGRLYGQLGLADPSKSGSITKCFELLIQKQMHDSMARMAAELASGELSSPKALDAAWQDAMTLIKEIGGNARYLTFSASQVPVDTARGQIAAGMCIDVYGRSQSEWEQRHIGRETMAYHTPTAASSVSCDPIGMFRGAPNRERAQMFIDFVLSQEGQRLWNIRLGVPGGPRRYSLQRLPVRSDMYTDEFRKDMSAPDAQPFQLAGKFTYEGAWTGALFGVLRVLIRVMVIDCQDELQAAWKAILDAGGPDAVPPEVMAEFAALPFAHEEGADIAKALRQSEQGTILAREWGLFFREHYGNVVKMLK